MHAGMIRAYEILPMRRAPARCTSMRYMPARRPYKSSSEEMDDDDNDNNNGLERLF